jgi:hypothetical protein
MGLFLSPVLMRCFAHIKYYGVWIANVSLLFANPFLLDFLAVLSYIMDATTIK